MRGFSISIALMLGIPGSARTLHPEIRVQETNPPVSADFVSARILLEDGTVAGGALVTLSSRSNGIERVADPVTGKVRLEKLRTGEYTLIARWEPKRDRSKFRKPSEQPSDELPETAPVWWGFRDKISPSSEELEVVLSRGKKQLVTVRTSDGKPVKKLHVRLALKSSEAFTPSPGLVPGLMFGRVLEIDRRIETNAGRFVLDGLAPGDWEYVIAVQDHGRTEVLTSSFPTETALEVSVPRSITISGEVHAADGAPSADCWVGIQYEKTLSCVFEDGQVATQTDAAGRFVIKSVRPGRATLKAEFTVRPAVRPERPAKLPRCVVELPLIIEPGKDLESLRLDLGEPK